MQLQHFGIAAILILGGALAVALGGPSSLWSGSAPTAPCSEPLTYTIGSIDSRFEIDRDELRDVMRKVEELWESSLDRDLLNYSENGEVAIHLIYSEEQQRTAEERRLSERIQRNKRQVDMLEGELKRLKKSYQSRQQELKKSLSDYSAAVNTFNDTIEKWNKRGGVPQSEKSTIEQMRRKIDRLETEINRKEQNAEMVRRRANAKTDQINRLIQTQNRMVDAYNEQFGESRKFDQGRYIRNGEDQRINIYQFGNLAELKTVLAHESGHAFGLNHVENPKSVMYPVMAKQNIFNLSLSEEDLKAIRERCKL